MGRRRELDGIDSGRRAEGVTTRLNSRTSERQRALDAARALRRDPTRSEAMLWAALRGKQMHGVKFRRQHPLGQCIVDFYCPQYRLVVEVDGSVHIDQTDRDEARQRALEASGYRILRVPAEQVEQNLGAVLEQIQAAIMPIGLYPAERESTSPPRP